MVSQSLPFAQAMLEIGQETGNEELFLKELKDIAQVYSDNADLVKVMGHPQISRDEKLKILRSLFEGSVSQTVMDFFQVLAQHRMAGELEQIAQEYQSLYDASHDIETVHVTSASALDEKQIQALKEKLEKQLKKQVRLKLEVDPALIAGLKIKTAGMSLDNSYAGRLEHMKELLLKS